MSVLPARVRFVWDGVEHVLSPEEANDLIGRIVKARDALKVECTKCHARIFPDEACLFCRATSESHIL